MLEVSEDNSKEVYDIIIDPGHGGFDPGAVTGKVYEKDLNLKLSLDLEKKLKAAGFNVLLTRTDDSSTPAYAERGRVSLPYIHKAKLFISVHHNSTHKGYEQSGLEIYVPNNTDYSFAQDMAKRIRENTGINYSTSKTFNVTDAIYKRTFSDYDIEDFRKDIEEIGNTMYESINNSTNYYFVLRETGGYMTGAYSDGRDKKESVNPYRNSNIGSESLLLELGYMNNSKDLKIIQNKKTEYVNAIAESIITNYSKYLKK